MPEELEGLLASLVDGVRRCYISDARLRELAASRGLSPAEVLAVVTPDPGSVMSGDFGEIVAFLYLGSRDQEIDPIGPKKWRLKNDRTKPAPHSDVVQFVVPDWPNASENDRVICAEVKTKATEGSSSPIDDALKDSEKDSLGRLARTLVWLKGRAVLAEDMESTTTDLLERFIEATDHPEATKTYLAVVVVCASLLEDEIAAAQADLRDERLAAVIAIPNLKDRYETTFEAIDKSVADFGGST